MTMMSQAAAPLFKRRNEPMSLLDGSILVPAIGAWTRIPPAPGTRSASARLSRRAWILCTLTPRPSSSAKSVTFGPRST